MDGLSDVVRRVRRVSQEAAFLKKQTGYREPIARDTDIVHDMGVAGIDGEKLADAVTARFGLTLSDEFILEHFGEELAMSPKQFVLWLLGRATLAEPLPVGYLYDMIFKTCHSDTKENCALNR